LQKGFDRYYGFLQGETDQFFPELTCDNHFIDPPGGPDDGYHVSEDIVDRGCDMVRNLTSLVPERPFFLYLAFGAMHSPHQAPRSYLETWRGRFDAGWDVAREEWFARQKAMGIVPEATRLAPRNPGVKPWTELTANEQAFAARLQEAFAAFLEHTDDQIGRLVQFLKSIHRFENTIFLLLSDNGASQEGGQTGVLDEMKWFNGIRENVDEAVARLDDIGGPDSHCNIPWGWAQAGNTPLRWYKQNTHGGGVRDPLIVHWPAGVTARGETRGQFCHAIDVAPTILDLAGLAPPKSVAGVAQMPMHGTSLAPALESATAAPARGAQYFEMLGHRGIWRDGWKAVTRHAPGQPFESDRWELYHLAEDFSEYEDLAEREPERLAALRALFNEEAERNGVFPLDDRSAMQLFRASGRPGLPTSRTRFVYHPPISHLVADACPPGARGFTMAIELSHPDGEADGALIARGSANSGFALYVKEGRLVFDYNHFHDHTRLAAPEALAAGARTVTVSVDRSPDGGGDIEMQIDGRVVGAGRAPKLLYMVSSTGMDIGRSLSPVTADYSAPFVYPGRIERVMFEVPDAKPRGEVRAEVRAEMVRQ
ncbi:MAG TPA: sulfatase-like hydrolase/transferase, partial [Caulobacteraceae bacterium]|nr:sulfatase-like hydrolase/transferase [Caulobacteraceae bacterium]